MAQKPTYFRSSAALRRWLEPRHDSATELWIGIYKQASGRGGITYPEALDEALCFGWIDGVRKRVDDDSFMQRFTPRRPRSHWTAVNIAKVEALIAAGRMHASGLAAYRSRDPKRSRQYSFENRPKHLDPRREKAFRANTSAWEFFRAQPPGYRRLAVWFVMSAKQDATRDRRLAAVIRDSAAGRRVGVVGGAGPPISGHR